MLNFEQPNAAYLQRIKKFPILTSEAEHSTACEYKENHSKRAAEIIINSHLRLVIKIAQGLKGYGLSGEELISEGNLGLIAALEKFDPNKEIRFSTYAIWWIKAYMQKYILNNSSLVKIGTSSAQKKLFFNLYKVEKKLQLSGQAVPNNDKFKFIAENIGVSIEDAKEMSMRMSSRDASLNRKVISFDDTSNELQDMIVDKHLNQEESYVRKENNLKRHQQLSQALTSLNPREKDILTSRKLVEKAKTLDELSNYYNISKERVRQIELHSINKVRKQIFINDAPKNKIDN